MERTSVESSNLRSIGWGDNRLEIEFKTGNIYQYSPITEDCYRELMAAESKGAYFAKHIKNNELVFCKQIYP